VLVGGFVGELIITFTCLLDYILASPQNQNFMFTVEMMETFLRELLGQDDTQFPEATCVVHINQSLEELSGGMALPYEHLAKAIRDPANLTDFGLSYLFEIQRDLCLSADIIDVVFKAVTKIATQHAHEPEELPIVPEDADEEQKAAFEEEEVKIKERNVMVEAENKKIEQIKTRVQIAVRPKDTNKEEMAFIKLNNRREEEANGTATPVPPPMSSSRTGNSKLEDERTPTPINADDDVVFQPEKIPKKVPLVKPVQGEINTIVYHSEAPYSVRRFLIEQAKKNFKELEKAELNALLSHSHRSSKMLEERIEENLIKTQGFNRGCMFQDQNSRILFKTFLKE